MRSTITTFLIALLAGAGAAAAQEQPTHLKDAIKLQKRMANSRPDDPGVLNDLGNLLTLAGASEEAEEVYRQALVIAPDEAATHYNLALLLRLEGRERAALRQLEKAVKLDPDDAWGQYQLGVLLEERRKRNRATHHFARAFILDPALAQFESNPQLLDSRLTTRAMMEAYQERIARFEMAPRRYAQPKRITRLLVPEVRDTAAAVSDGSEATVEEPDGKPTKAEREGRRRKRANDGGS